jgi:hypothetical protein
MRRIFMGALIGLGLITVQQNAKAIIRLTAPPEDPAKEFWIESRSLAQEQLRLLDRMEQSLTQQPDTKRLQVMKGQVFLHLTALDRYLQSNHPDPVEFCNVPHSAEGEVAGTDAISPEEATVYCSLFQSGQEMAGVRAYLDRQLKLGTRPTFQPTSIGTKKIPATPAQMHLNSTLAMVQSARERILQARPLFPVAFQPAIPDAQPAIASTQYPDFLATEWKPHADFLAQPNTGIARLGSAELFLAADPSRTQSQSQLAFPVVANRANGFSPRLPIRVTGNLFQVIPSGLDYGFVADMGDVPLGNLQVPQGESLRSLPKLLQFFYTYRPPTQLEGIQSDRKRFTSGNVADFGLKQPLSNYISAQLNRTYLVRSVQYKVPELMTAGRTVSQDERQLLERLSQAQSSDILVAIRPVNLRPDGTYTILWKLVKQFPDPQIRDLNKTTKQIKPAPTTQRKV